MRLERHLHYDSTSLMKSKCHDGVPRLPSIQFQHTSTAEVEKEDLLFINMTRATRGNADLLVITLPPRVKEKPKQSFSNTCDESCCLPYCLYIMALNNLDRSLAGQVVVGVQIY